MVRQLLPAAVLLGVVLAVPAVARAQTSLRWQLKAGEKFYVEEAIKADQNVTVMGMNLKQTTTTRRVSQFTVKAADAGGYQLEQKILTWTAKQEGGAAPDDGKLDKVARGATFRIHLAPNGTLSRFQGYEDFLKKIGDQDANEAKVFRMILTEDAIKSPLEMIFSVLPAKAVKQGDQWQQKLKVPTGPMGTFLFDVDYKYRGAISGDLVEFAMRGKFEYKPPTKEVEGAPFTIKKADLKSTGSTGTVTFDARAGRLVRYTLTMPVSGSLTLEVMMNQLEMSLDGTETRTIRLLTKNPVTD